MLTAQSTLKLLSVATLSAGLAGCSGGGSASSPVPPTPSPTPPAVTGATTVYVIQNPTMYGKGSGTVLAFAATASGDSSPTSMLSAPLNTSFDAVASDSSGNVYVEYGGPSNQGGIAVYASGATGAATPTRTLLYGATTGVTAVDSIAASSSGEIFVGEDYGGVQAFSAAATGNTAPTRRILGAFETGGGLSTIGAANGIASDGADNLYVVNQGNIGAQPILVFGPTATGNVAPIRTIGGSATGLSTGTVIGIATDAAANVYVTVDVLSGPASSPVYTGSILEFASSASGNIAPIRTITGPLTSLHALAGIKVDSIGNIYVVSASTPGVSNLGLTVLKFSATASGNVAPTSAFTSATWTLPDNGGSIALK